MSNAEAGKSAELSTEDAPENTELRNSPDLAELYWACFPHGPETNELALRIWVELREARKEVDRLEDNEIMLNAELSVYKHGYERINAAASEVIGVLKTKCERLEQQAVQWKMEDAGHKSSLFECYRAVTGGTGEPADWHGARPVVECIESLRAQVAALKADNAELRDQLNTPEVEDFTKAVVSEAQHQRHRWGADHDRGKSPLDWFWLIGYLAQKAATAHTDANLHKAKHHTISTAAALANWHAAIAGDDTSMVPGAPLPIEAEADARLEGEDS
ncbi:MAG: hypothetical protein AAFW60_01855 [Pseudomonadota bacterium]